MAVIGSSTISTLTSVNAEVFVLLMLASALYERDTFLDDGEIFTYCWTR